MIVASPRKMFAGVAPVGFTRACLLAKGGDGVGNEG